MPRLTDAIAPSPLALRIQQQLTPLAVFDATPNEIPVARDLAARLIGGPNVSAEVAARVRARQGGGIYVTRSDGEVTGVLALVFLTAAGEAAVTTELFDPLDPADAHVVVSGSDPCAVYAWGIAAADRDAARALVQTSWALGPVLGHVPFYVRAATEAGRRLLCEKMSFTLYPGSTTGLLWAPGQATLSHAA